MGMKISWQGNTDNRRQSTRKVNLNIEHQMMSRRASLNMCQTAQLYVHLMVPVGRSAVSAAIQDGSLLPWAPPIHLACMNSSKREPKWCNLPGGRLHIKMWGCMKRGDMGDRFCVGRRVIKNLKKMRGEVSDPRNWKPHLKDFKDAEVTQMSESANTWRESHWSSHNLISPKVQQHEFATLSDSFYIIRATWPTISFCAPSLTQLSHLQHSASFMSKNQKSTEREERAKQCENTPTSTTCLLFVSNKHQQSSWVIHWVKCHTKNCVTDYLTLQANIYGIGQIHVWSVPGQNLKV